MARVLALLTALFTGLYTPVVGQLREITAVSPAFKVAIRSVKSAKTQQVKSVTAHSNPFSVRIMHKQRASHFMPRSKALFIANSVYDDGDFKDLLNTRRDADTLNWLLKTRFDFETEVATDASFRSLDAILRKSATQTWAPDQQLLIYIAGHGLFDESIKQGYLVVKDSRKALNERLYSLTLLKSILDNHPCRHIMLIMDICYGGTVVSQTATTSFQATNAPDCAPLSGDLAAYFTCMQKERTRIFLTSTGLDVVPGGREKEISPFARALLQELTTNTQPISGRELGKKLNRLTPQPTFVSEATGDFIFIPR